jgi:hypothetical protein
VNNNQSKIANILIDSNKQGQRLIERNNRAQQLFEKIEYQLKLIYEGQPLINSLYALNLDKQVIWDGVFGEIKLKDILKIEKTEIIDMVHKFASARREMWLKPLNKSKKISQHNINNYSHKQIATAYMVMDKQITPENVSQILKQHSALKSTQKLLQKRITNVAELTKLSGNKSADTKHLKDLQAAKRLISSIKNKKAILAINQIITVFSTSYNNNY